MKKRIIASTMASVMAISTAATALVASADVKDFKTEAVTKKGLEDFLADKEIQALVDGDVEEFGSTMGNKFLKAIEMAEGLLEDPDATTADYTVAYQMVKAIYDKLEKKTAAELQGLINECKADYATNNEINDRHEAKWTTGTWDNFRDAYEEAEDVVDSEDTLEITDAFFRLEDTHGKLSPLASVTKTEMNKARRAYEKLVKMEFDYQPWQRGTVSGCKISAYNNKTFAWGTLYAHVFSAEASLVSYYKEFTDLAGFNEITTDADIVKAVNAMNNAVSVLESFKADTMESKSRQGNVEDLLGKYQGQLVYTYKNDDAVAAIMDLASVIAAVADVSGNSVAADASFDTVKSIIAFKQNTGVFKTAEDLESTGNLVSWDTTSWEGDDANGAGNNKGIYWNRSKSGSGDKTLSASLEIMLKKPSSSKAYSIFYVLDKDEKLNNGKNAFKTDGTTYFYATKAAAEAAAGAGNESYVKEIKADRDSIVISDFIKVTAADIIAGETGEATVSGLDTEETAVKDAMTALDTALTTYLGTITAAQAVTLSTADPSGTKGDIAEADATAITSALSALKKTVDDTKTAITTAKATVNKTNLAKVATEYAKISTAAAAIATACPSSLDDGGTPAAGKLDQNDYNTITAAGTVDASVGTAYNTASTGFAATKTAYDDAYDAAAAAGGAAASAAAATKTTATLNGTTVYDQAGEVLADDLTITPITGESDFAFVPYDSSRTDGHDCDETAVSLPRAVKMYETFTTGDWSDIVDIDNRLTFREDVDMSKSPRGDAWKLLYNYMNYALKDMFVADPGKTYTKKDIEKLIDDVDALIDKTYKFSLFSQSTTALVKDRTGAIEWLKLAAVDENKNKNKETRYKDYISTYSVKTRNTSAQTFDSTAMYNWVKASYDQLNKELGAFKYSFDEIIKYMNTIAKDIDSNKFDADTTKKLKKDLAAASLALLDVSSLTQTGGTVSDVDGLYNDDGTWNRANRLFTNNKNFTGVMTVMAADGHLTNGTGTTIVTIKDIDNGDSDITNTHKAMTSKYEALDKDYQAALKALETPKMTEDLNGSGKLDLGDVQELLKLVVDGKGEVAKHDFNGDKAVNMADVQFLLTKWVNA